MKTHICRTVSSCFCILRQIRSIRRSVWQQNLQSLMVSMLAGVASNQLDGLQSVMNAAARLVCSARKCDHITPLLQDLHWLRVPQRIEFKLAVLAFRCLHRARYGTAIPCMRTAPCGRHGLLTATSFCFHGRAEHSTNMSCHRWWPRLWYMTEPRDTVTFNFFLLLSALEFFFWLYGTLIMFIILIIIRPHHVWKYGIHPICDGWD